MNKMSKITTALLTALVAISSLVLWSCASKQPQPSDSDIEKALVTQLPTFTRVSGLSIEAKRNLGTNFIWQAQVRATITVTTDTFALDNQNSEVIFVRPVKLSGESIEVFGKSRSTLSAGAWQTTFELEGQPIEMLGQPLSAFGPKKVIVRGGEDEKQYLANQQNAEMPVVQQKAPDCKISNIKIVPFDSSTGAFREEIKPNEDPGFFNEFGISLLVVVEISSQAYFKEISVSEANKDIKVEITVMDDNEQKAKKIKQIGLHHLMNDEKIFVPVWLDPLMCGDIKITARIIGQKTVSTMTRTVPFECGE